MPDSSGCILSPIDHLLPPPLPLIFDGLAVYKRCDSMPDSSGCMLFLIDHLLPPSPSLNLWWFGHVQKVWHCARFQWRYAISYRPPTTPPPLPLIFDGLVVYKRCDSMPYSSGCMLFPIDHLLPPSPSLNLWWFGHVQKVWHYARFQWQYAISHRPHLLLCEGHAACQEVKDLLPLR